MKHLKHLFTALLLLCTTVATAHDFEVDGIYYDITYAPTKTVAVTYRGSYDFSYSNEYTGSVVIPESVTYDGTTYSVTSIGYYALRGCYGLTSIVIPNSVTSIGDDAFYGCTGLTSIVVAKGNSAYDSRNNCNAIIGTSTNTLIYGCKNTVIPNSITSICEDAFYGCSGLTSIEIPNSVTSIGNYAFEGCSGLTSIEIPNSVTSIGEFAFQYCTGLTSITIPNSVTSIGEFAFQYCTGLTSITIPNSVTSIGDYAFGDCSGLTSIEFNAENCTSMGSSSYPVFENCTALSIVTIGENVKTIPSYAFYGCSGLTSVVIPNSVTSIGVCAFFYCSGLTSVVIPDSVTSIGGAAFEDCSGLTSVVIGNSVTSIGNYAFEGCSGLTSIVIPNSVTSIENHAFSGCTGLTSVEIGNSVTSIGDWAFSDCSGLKTVINFSNLTFSKGSSRNGDVAYYADKVINAPNGLIEGDYIWCKLNGVNTLACYFGDATEFVLPVDYNGENYAIGNDAFYGCSGLTSIEIPNSVTSIGRDAFYGCNNIERLYVGNSVESIGINAFAGCDKIKEIKIGLEKPIRGAANIFADAVYDNAVLYVPIGTKSLYEKREPWNLFFDIVEMDFTGIDEVKGENGEVKTVYDLSGRVVENPSSGIYIINGKKVIIK